MTLQRRFAPYGRLVGCAYVVLAVGCVPSRATNPEPAPAAVHASPDAGHVEDLSPALDAIRRKSGVPALAGAVWRGGELVAIGVSGVRKQGDPTPATIRDSWHLGSDTKAMTATLIGIYVDRGKIRLDDTLGTLFRGETIDPGYANVTLEQLLQHAGGAPAKLPRDVMIQMWDDGDAPDARIKAVRAVLARAPEQKVGTFTYSNLGYVIAAAALERKLDASWERLLAADVFAPLHMDGCGFGAPGSTKALDQPWGHRPKQSEYIPIAPGPAADNHPALGPAGTVHCSLADWGKFLTMHLRAARGESTMLSKETISRLQKPRAGTEDAAGWLVVSRPWAGGIALSHSGTNTMWMATTWIAPAKNLVFAAVANAGGDTAAEAVDSTFDPMTAAYIAPPK